MASEFEGVLKSIVNLLSRRGDELVGERLPAIPDGQRVYAVGDIHGRLDLFERMISTIESDDTARDSAETLVILLGDLVDRGPESAKVIAAARAWQQRRPVRLLMGNHEEMFLRAMEDETALRHFLRVGGRETVLSYGLDPNEYRALSIPDLRDRLAEIVPTSDIGFLRAMEDMIRVGDYLFVHAGIDPAVSIEAQHRGDLRWIREPFLSHPEPFGVCVVHGHTIREDVEVRIPRRGRKGWPNRIGIDTGAFRSNRLTAIGLQGSERWFMEASL